MYRPNFCCECGEKVIRLRWRVWHSLRFCSDCAKHHRKERFTRPLLIGVVLICFGVIAGRAMRPAPPPLIIQRSANSPLLDLNNRNRVADKSEGQDAEKTEVVSEEVYICGARTKKGTPCSRRVPEPNRCWQHKGMPAMLPHEKLVVK